MENQIEGNQIKVNVENLDQPAPKRWIILFGGAALAVFIAGGVFAAYGYYEIYMSVDRAGAAPVEFEVKKGIGVKEISWQLEEMKLIRSAWWFQTYVWYENLGSSLQAGKYALARNFNVPQMVSVITGGKVVLNETKITFPEGFTYRQIKERLAEQGLSLDEALGGETIGDYQMQYKFLGDAPVGAGLEGFLFPDTYIFGRDDKAPAVVKKFLDNFDKKLTPDLREQISQQNKTIFNIIILASVIQQEAIDEADMPLVAGVFANRLRLGMLLQSDATVNYATGKKARQATAEDIKINSPYNTYLNKGLPPGPIANPGIAAIKAAIAPSATDYLYFLHPLDSETIFSKTLDEHNRNKAKYLK